MGISKTEVLWETIVAKSGAEYYITSKAGNRNCYYIYKEMSGGGAVKLGKGKTPAMLEQKYVK